MILFTNCVSSTYKSKGQKQHCFSHCIVMNNCCALSFPLNAEVSLVLGYSALRKHLLQVLLQLKKKHMKFLGTEYQKSTDHNTFCSAFQNKSHTCDKAEHHTYSDKRFMNRTKRRQLLHLLLKKSYAWFHFQTIANTKSWNFIRFNSLCLLFAINESTHDISLNSKKWLSTALYLTYQFNDQINYKLIYKHKFAHCNTTPLPKHD